jgi:hypothetical protein
VTSHTTESAVTDTEAVPVSARLRIDPAAPGAKTTTAATPTSVNPARKSWMMRTGSPLTELLGHLTLDLMDAVEAPNPLDVIMPGAAPFLKRFARHPHTVQHQDGATATRTVRAMTHQEGYRPPG